VARWADQGLWEDCTHPRNAMAHGSAHGDSTWEETTRARTSGCPHFLEQVGVTVQQLQELH
jgi:hypothetical protein